MREVIIVIRCDRCGNAMAEDEAQVIAWTWQGQPLQVEVDAKCADELTSDRVESLLEMSTTVEQAPVARKSGTKPGTKPGTKVNRADGGVVMTTRLGERVMRFKPSEYEREFGADDGRLACPRCDYSASESHRLAAHTRDSHGEKLWQILADRLADAAT